MRASIEKLLSCGFCENDSLGHRGLWGSMEIDSEVHVDRKEILKFRV